MIARSRPHRAYAAIVVALVATACDVTATPSTAAPLPEIEPEAPIYRLRGTWLAVDIIVTSEADPTQEVSLVPRGGVLSLRIHDDQTYVLLSSLTGGPADREQGTLVVGDSTLTLTASHITRPSRVFTFGWRFERLVLRFTQEFDVDRDGVGEAARFYAELVDVEFGYREPRGRPEPLPAAAPPGPQDVLASRSFRDARVRTSAAKLRGLDPSVHWGVG